MIKLTRFTFIIFIGLIFNSCEPIANQFDDFEDAVMYESLIIKEFPSKKTIKVMTWNIRFGVARLRFFGDGCGSRVIMTKKEVISFFTSLQLLTITNFSKYNSNFNSFLTEKN